ncbi:hypothetical protein HGRIS_010616 [Hohenbuehelia grisea]|uniref:Uncharacterized protein n=1 Tax=Hohenbuehelia grisea TaxID=104357 RepID=A0ABR3IXA0_9AGAR
MSQLDVNKVSAAINQAYFEILFNMLFYGIFCVLALGSMFILYRHGIPRTPARTFMFHIIFTYKTTRLRLDPDSMTPSLNYTLNIIMSAGTLVCRCNYVLSDLVVVWRVWTIWGKRKDVMFVLGFFFVASQNINEAGRSKAGLRAMVFALPTLATNLVSTAIILYQARRRRHLVADRLGTSSATERVTHILFWLIESAAIYCIAWIVYILAAFQVFGKSGGEVIDGTMVHISGIYPTIIIALVAVDKSKIKPYAPPQGLDSDLVAMPMRFASNPETWGLSIGSIHSTREVETNVDAYSSTKTLDRNDRV